MYLFISQGAMLSPPKLLTIPPEPLCMVISEYKLHNKRNFAYVYQQNKPEWVWFLKPFTFPDSDSIT